MGRSKLLQTDTQRKNEFAKSLYGDKSERPCPTKGTPYSVEDWKKKATAAGLQQTRKETANNTVFFASRSDVPVKPKARH